MKYTYLILLGLLLSTTLCGAAINGAEYFFDVDPGAGSGIPLDLSAGSLVAISDTLPTAGLTPGLHRYFIRYRDDDGVWSGVEMRYVYRFAPAGAIDRLKIDQAEAWFDNGSAFAVDVADSSLTGFITDLPVAQLAPGLHILNVRYRDAHGVWGGAGSCWVYNFADADTLGGLITEAELWFDNQPHTALDVSDGRLVSLNTLMAVTGLSEGLHTLNVRYHAQNGEWGPAQGALIYKFADVPPSSAALTDAEIWFDNSAHTPVDVGDGNVVNLSAALPVLSLSPGLHVLNARYRDAQGKWGAPGSQLVYRFTTPPPLDRQITQAEIQVDADAPQNIDLADSARVPLATLLPTAALSYGQHQLSVRYRDNTGCWSEKASAPVFVIPGSSAHLPSYIAGAEYFINYDPGEGHGVPLAAADGQWDSQQESVNSNLGGIPAGQHWIGLRFRDNYGHWTETVRDSFWVGPLLTIRAQSPDIILDWTVSLSGAEFFVYRAPTVSGPYALVDSTFGTTYTDAGALTADTRRYYFITHSGPAPLSDYRWPPPAAIKD